MALRTLNTTSDTLASTTAWDSNTNTATISSATNITVSTGGIFSATFTAPNTSNACTGAWVYVNAQPSASATFTLTLQEATVDTAATITVNQTVMPASGNWIYFRFPTPYVFTATTAGRYRFKLAASSSTTNGVASDSGGSNFAYIATDNRTGALGSTDDLWIGAHNCATSVTATWTGTSTTIGSGTDITAANITARSVGHGVNLYGGVTAKGIIACDTTATSTISCKGNVYIGAGGEHQMGTVASPLNSAYIATWKFNPATAGDHGIKLNTTGGRMIWQGTPHTNYKTKYVSGTGITADPMIVTDGSDFAVGDELLICATSDNSTNYQESELRFVTAKPTANSIVLANTAGGADAALTYTHNTNAWILNLQRNVIITTTNTARGWYLAGNSQTAGDIDLDWFRIEYDGTNSGGGDKLAFAITSFAGSVDNLASCDGAVCYKPNYRGIRLASSNQVVSISNCIGLMGTANADSGLFVADSNAQNYFTDCFAVQNLRLGFELSNSYENYLTRCYAIGNNTTNSGGGSGFAMTNGGGVLESCEGHCNRQFAVSFSSNVPESTLTNCLFGTKGKNPSDVRSTTNVKVNVDFDSCTFGSDVFWGSVASPNSYKNMLPSSEVRFNKKNNTDYNHAWYTKYGYATSTGTGLTDTTVRTPNSYGVALHPEDATTGFTWSFQIPANAGKVVNFFGWFRKNALLGSSTARIELWLPNSSVADATYTLTNSTDVWQAASLSAAYNGTVDYLATVRIVVISNTAGAILYCDDFYNAGDGTTSTDRVTGLDTWFKAKPVTPMSPSAVSPAAIWTYDLTNVSTPGVAGKKLKDGLEYADWAGEAR